MKKSVQTLLISFFFAAFAQAVDVSSISATQPPYQEQTEQNYPPQNTQQTTQNQMQAQQTIPNSPATNTQNLPEQLPAVFGAHLFNGNFTQASQSLYNPDYKIAVGDKINFRMWGAVEFQQELMVDSQGNVFIPSVGAVNLLGIRNGDLVKVLKSSIAKIYKQNVFVYADMNVYQNVSIFVTGNVNRPGLYQGLSSDSVVQYLDKAGGINLEYGSFRNIEILRNNKIALNIDLYDFLFEGKMKLFPFRTGDVILVKNIESYAFAEGDVQKPFRFELKNNIKTLQDLANAAGAKPIVTNAVVRSYLPNHTIDVVSYNKKDFQSVLLRVGDEVEFRPDYNAENIHITIEGEHSGLHSMVVKKGTSLAEVVLKLKPNQQSNIDAIQLYRVSVAQTQKQLIEAQLKELETIALTSSSVTAQEASMRASHSQMVLEFIERAKNVQPKGQVVLENKQAFTKTILEEGDIINIPAKSNLVLVQGEVALPGAFTHEPNKSLRDYIKLAGDFTERANKKRILVIRSNGKAERYNGNWSSGTKTIQPGDSVLVLPEIETGRGLQITSILTQILYQVAVATKVILDL